MKIGITGQSGFIGYHLGNYVSLNKGDGNIEIVPFENSFFADTVKLRNFLLTCDVVIHLAGKNRGPAEEVYDCNVKLASILIRNLDEYHANPHLIFASSTQEEINNSYGRSKKEATNMFIDWAKRNDARFNALMLPNVFGPFCKPFYNSVIATFCYQLTHEQEPKIEVDAILKLIYVNDLVEYIYTIVEEPPDDFRVYPQGFSEMKVSAILSKLTDFTNTYLRNNIIPGLPNAFDVALFNTFRSYLDLSHFPVQTFPQSDERGYLVEVVKEKTGGQVFYSSTKPGLTRGNHYHRRKIERFFVLKGVASIKLRRVSTNQVNEYRLTGDQPCFIDIPIFYTHNITNVGNENLQTLFWTNELYKKEDPDTYYEAV